MTGDLSTTLYNPYQVTRELGDVYFQAPMKIGHCQLGKDVVDHFSLNMGRVAVADSPLGRLILESDGETLKEILKYLEPRDLLTMRRVCTLFFDQMLVKYPGLFLVTQKPTQLRNGYNQGQFLTYPSLHLTSYQFTVEDPNYFYPNRDFYINLLDDIQEVAVKQKLPWAENIKEMDPRRVVFLTVRHYFQEFFAFTKGTIVTNDDFDKLNLLQWWYLLRPRYFGAERPWEHPRGGFLALWKCGVNANQFLGVFQTPYTLDDVRLFKPTQLKALTDVIWYNLLTCCDWSTIVLSKQDTSVNRYYAYDRDKAKWLSFTGQDLPLRRERETTKDYFSHDFFRMLADFEADELAALGILLPFCSFVYGFFYIDNQYDDQVFLKAMQGLAEYETEKRAESAPIYTINHVVQVRQYLLEQMGSYFEGYPTFSEFLRCWVYDFGLRNTTFLNDEGRPDQIFCESLPFFPQANLANGMSEVLWQGVEIVETVTQVVKVFHSMRDEFRVNAQNHCSFVPNFLAFYNAKDPTDAH